MLGVLPLGCVLEMVPVHLLLRQRSPMLAWIATAVSVYAVIWLIGLARALRLLPVLVSGESILLRYGLLYQVKIPKEVIAGVRPANAGDRAIAIPRRSEPTLCIEFTQTLEATKLFGIRKHLDRVAITPDDQPAFERAVRELIAG